MAVPSGHALPHSNLQFSQYFFFTLNLLITEHQLNRGVDFLSFQHDHSAFDNLLALAIATLGATWNADEAVRQKCVTSCLTPYLSY